MNIGIFINTYVLEYPIKFAFDVTESGFTLITMKILFSKNIPVTLSRISNRNSKHSQYSSETQIIIWDIQLYLGTMKPLNLIWFMRVASYKNIFKWLRYSNIYIYIYTDSQDLFIYLENESIILSIADDSKVLASEVFTELINKIKDIICIIKDILNKVKDITKNIIDIVGIA